MMATSEMKRFSHREIIRYPVIVAMKITSMRNRDSFTNMSVKILIICDTKFY